VCCVCSDCVVHCGVRTSLISFYWNRIDCNVSDWHRRRWHCLHHCFGVQLSRPTRRLHWIVEHVGRKPVIFFRNLTEHYNDRLSHGAQHTTAHSVFYLADQLNFRAQHTCLVSQGFGLKISDNCCSVMQKNNLHVFIA